MGFLLLKIQNMKKLTDRQKEIIKENIKHGMSVDYIAELLGYRFPWFKVQFKKQIEEYIKNELQINLEQNSKTSK